MEFQRIGAGARIVTTSSLNPWQIPKKMPQVTGLIERVACDVNSGWRCRYASAGFSSSRARIAAIRVTRSHDISTSDRKCPPVATR